MRLTGESGSPAQVHRPFLIGPCLFGLLLLGMPLGLRAQRAAPYESIAVTDGATLNGRVLFSGDVPEPKKLLITKDPEVCGDGYRERREVVAGADGGLRSVVVFIDGIETGKAWQSAGEGYVLNQKSCTFDPNLQVVPRGASLEIVNSDPVLHNIHSYELIGRSRRTLFNFGQPPEKGTITKELKPRRGNQVRLECDAHDFMQGWIYVADNPYYAVAGPDGSFEILDVPPGTYTVNAWHPYLGLLQQEVTFEPSSGSEIVFEFGGS